MRSSLLYFLGKFLLGNSDGASCYLAPSDENTFNLHIQLHDSKGGVL